jgi:hypothetical protein
MAGGMQTPTLGRLVPIGGVSAGDVTIIDTDGELGTPGASVTLQDFLDAVTGDFLTVINGGGGTVQAHGNLGSTETIDTANGNYHWGTLNANCTFTFTTIADTAERWFTLELIEDGTGGWTVTWPGSVAWLGGTTPTHTTTAGTTTIYAFFTRNGGTTWVGGQLGGSTSPLTTKGDLHGFSTTDARVAVGADGTRLRADSTQALGFGWSALIWTPVTVFDPTTGNYLPAVDGSGNQIMVEA